MDDRNNLNDRDDTLRADERPVKARPFSLPDADATAIAFDLRAVRSLTSPTVPPFPAIDQSPVPAMVDLLAVISLLVAFGVYSYRSGLAERIGAWVPSVGALGWVFANGLIAMLCVGMTLKLRGQSFRALGLRRTPLRLLIPVTLAAAPAAWLTGIVCNIAYLAFQTLRGVSMDHLMRDRLGFISAISEINLYWVAPISIFVGIYEEIFFRGFVMSRLASATRSRTIAVILSSLLFGAVHFAQGPLGIFQTTCLGLVLAFAAVKARSLWPAIIAHVAIDSFGLGISVLLRSDILNALHELTTTQAGS